MVRTCTMTILLLATELSYGQAYITTERWGGRFGDQLLLYRKAKALSASLSIPYMHRPFCHSDQLKLHYTEHRLPSLTSFSRVIITRKIEELQRELASSKGENVLCLIKFRSGISVPGLPTDFRDRMRSLISPQKPIRPLKVPTGTTTIAVHIRKGDVTGNQHYFGQKWHRDEEYIKLLRPLLEQLGNIPTYVYIFTDDAKPSTLARKFEAACKKRNASFAATFCSDNPDKHAKRIATFGSADNSNTQTSNAIVTDFFNMASCDYLIRPYGSAFSLMAEYIGKHKAVLVPPCKPKPQKA